MGRCEINKFMSEQKHYYTDEKTALIGIGLLKRPRIAGYLGFLDYLTNG